MVIIVKWYNLFSYCKYLLKNRTRSISIMNMGFLVENILTKHYLCYFLIEMIVVTYSHVNCDKFVFDLCWLLLYMLILFCVISITFNLISGILLFFVQSRYVLKFGHKQAIILLLIKSIFDWIQLNCLANVLFQAGEQSFLSN